MTTIDQLTRAFVADLEAMFAEHTNQRLRSVLAIGTITIPKHKPERRKGPIQLCPVPRCKGRAAPVFHMVCAEHKDVPAATIKKYRAARRLKKGRA